MEKEMRNEEFFKKYEAYEKGSTECFIKRYSPTESELRETIAYLIEQGQTIGAVKIEKLEAGAKLQCTQPRRSGLPRAFRPSQ